MMVGNFKEFFLCKESQILLSNNRVKQHFFVRLLSELHVLSLTIYVISTDMAVSLADLTAFFQDEGKSIKRGENLYESGFMLRAAATRKGSQSIL